MSWLRRNKWGLLALPVALLLSVAASSSRVVTLWWPEGPHAVQSGAVGEPVRLTQDWQDRSGHYVRDVTVTVTGIERTTSLRNWDNEDEPATVPDGTTLWRVSLDVAADPDQVLRGCQLEVIDTLGREYAYSALHVKPARFKTSPCLNSGEAGPLEALLPGETHVDDEPRPETWSTVADVVLAEDAVPATVRIWWDYPEVIEVPVTP